MLLIDELDKVDDGFEAMLLEILSAWQLSIPEFGTVAAKSIPFVVLTSNEERRLGDPIRRRSLYVRVEHPTPEREAEIIASRTPKADESFHREMAGIALSFRNYSLEKPPSVSEMIDFANALQLLGTDHVTEEHRDVLLAVPGEDREGPSPSPAARRIQEPARRRRQVRAESRAPTEDQHHEAMRYSCCCSCFPVSPLAQADPAPAARIRTAVCGALSRAAGVDRRVDRRRIAMESASSFRQGSDGTDATHAGDGASDSAPSTPSMWNRTLPRARATSRR